ncbi:albumin-1 E-like [Vicia villosa]|uniref:albumin-1 E-like n=1 Tax=Vicia villosa TaxID=3911 RepID=UPI00273AA077|nr:albumin-1 E-like [Vicia villosa]
MTFVNLASLVVLFATFGMFLTKNVGALCDGTCSLSEPTDCASGSRSCKCLPIMSPFEGVCIEGIRVDVKTIEEHPNLCKSHADCIKKGSGNFCARYSNPNIEYGWCFASKYEAEDVFLKMSSTYKFTKDFLKNVVTA